MILSDRFIKTLLKNKTLKIDPLPSSSIQSASVDLRLDRQFSLLEYWSDMKVLDLRTDPKYLEIEKDEMIIPPHFFLLGITKEFIKLPSNITAFLEGRSTIGRMGLFIQNAEWIAPGFEGRIVLELYNANTMPIRLRAGHRICQIVLCQMDQEPEKIYQGKYQNQRSLIGSKASLDVENQ